MVEQLLINNDDYYVPDANQLVTEDDTPADNFASAQQQRLLVTSIYTSLQQQTFLAEAKRVFEKFLGVKFYASRLTIIRIIAR